MSRASLAEVQAHGHAQAQRWVALSAMISIVEGYAKVAFVLHYDSFRNGVIGMSGEQEQGLLQSFP